MITRIFPFLLWFRKYNASILQADFIAGLNVALVLIPQSMAYAQLAGLPVYYGLYASFLPPMLAAMFGSSNQLATGPVAVVSLMTAAALEPLATQGSEGYIAYAILLALLVGIFQFLLGIFRLGVIVNFLSHPVVHGFTNAAALIIATSQLSKIFGVSVDKAEHHYETILRVLHSAWYYTHWPTFFMSALAFTIMFTMKKYTPKIPNVLVAVVVTTLLSWSMGFRNVEQISLEAIPNPQVKVEIQEYNEAVATQKELSEERASLSAELQKLKEEKGIHSPEVIQLRGRISILNLHIEEGQSLIHQHRQQIRRFLFIKRETDSSQPVFYLQDEEKESTDGSIWRLKVGNQTLDSSQLTMTAGGDVVGTIPQGLPSLKIPLINWSIIMQLFPMAIIISILGFMEAISIAKAMASRTGQRLDPNQELIGQGIANIAGSFNQSYAVSGSFSRSAVNIQAGAITGMSSVFTSCFVVIVLLFFTPLLYYLPQGVLAAIIMMAVIGLIDFSSVLHAWHVQKTDGLISIITFVGTLMFAPHLERGIFIGVILSLSVALYRHMRPELVLLSKHPDGSFRNAQRWNLQQCKYIAVIRFHGSLFFANASYLEDKILELVSSMRELKHVLIVGNAINELDATGEEILSKLVDRLHEAGYEVSISGMNDSIIEIMKKTPLYQKIGEKNLFRNVSGAIHVIHAKSHEDSTERECPLLVARIKDFKPWAVHPDVKQKMAAFEESKGSE